MLYKFSFYFLGLYRCFKSCLLCGAWLAMMGCSMLSSSKVDPSLTGPKSFSPKWPGLVLSAANDVNANSAVAIDIVFAGTLEVQTIVQNMSAGKWFSTRDGTMRTFSETLKVISLELVPGQTVMLNKNDYAKLMSTGVFVFANYSTPGEHKSWLPLDDSGHVITLENQTFKVASVVKKL